MAKEYSFRKGWNQVRKKDAKKIKAEIMTAFEIRGRMSWIRHLNGTIEPKISEYKKINSIFRKYGITEVWGEN
jgi:hypothetical protein